MKFLRAAMLDAAIGKLEQGTEAAGPLAAAALAPLHELRREMQDALDT